MRTLIIGSISLGAIFIWLQLRQLRGSKHNNHDKRTNKKQERVELDVDKGDK